MISHRLLVSSAAFIIKQIRVWITPQSFKSSTEEAQQCVNSEIKCCQEFWVFVCSIHTRLGVEGKQCRAPVDRWHVIISQRSPQIKQELLFSLHVPAPFGERDARWLRRGGRVSCFCAEALTQHPEVTLKHVCLLWNAAATLPVQASSPTDTFKSRILAFVFFWLCSDCWVRYTCKNRLNFFGEIWFLGKEHRDVQTWHFIEVKMILHLTNLKTMQFGYWSIIGYQLPTLILEYLNCQFKLEVLYSYVNRQTKEN